MMLKGMTIQQFTQVVDFAQQHHPFGGTTEGLISFNYQHHIKYIDSIYDSRFQVVWNVAFRGMGTNIQFRTNHFMEYVNKKPDNFKFETLYDWIMAYLKGEWLPSEYMAKHMYVNS